ncbi:hypothetical protein OGATHE_001124 [Ogataea polymorpha]|uniref:Uncharacterized protein n=1 Tax=Ogataea polymorpha TaxID=460523 RepID=A0A9P8PS82_9ASCO|nr:hypothetical protein OGATHE_001124 [Ogataea polymorpha]
MSSSLKSSSGDSSSSADPMSMSLSPSDSAIADANISWATFSSFLTLRFLLLKKFSRSVCSPRSIFPKLCERAPLRRFTSISKVLDAPVPEPILENTMLVISEYGIRTVGLVTKSKHFSSG